MNTQLNFGQSAAGRLGHSIHAIIETISNRYIGEHPAIPFTFRSIPSDGFKQLEDGRYDLNLADRYPSAQHGQYGYILGLIWSESEQLAESAINCYGPTQIHLNGRQVYKSDIADEVNYANKLIISIQLSRGWNTIFVKLQKTASGFGCLFGSNRSKWLPFDVMAPFADRAGQAGWVYTGAYDSDIFANHPVPDCMVPEAATSLSWMPRLHWDQQELQNGMFTRLFGKEEGSCAFAWTRFSSPSRDTVTLIGQLSGAGRIWVNNELVHEQSAGGSFECEVSSSSSMPQDLLIESISSTSEWGFELSAKSDSAIAFQSPAMVKGCNDPWLLLGALSASHALKPTEICSLSSVFQGTSESVYWTVNQPNRRIRPYSENKLFGKWNYPLGVTLYGMLQAGRLLGRPDIIQYVKQHVTACTRFYAYSLWDAETYGFPALNQQLVELNMLDDCGSFGSVMLEVSSDTSDPSIREVADVIADYMLNKQERKSDGVYYRARQGFFYENTLWADDLYMSTPFLIRYYKMTGNRACLDEAARQFLLFKKYLYLPEVNLMSHVYDFKYNTATGIPWGRGNGWPLFSLSELLEVLPVDHQDYTALMTFFIEFCDGVRTHQGSEGLWHQVLTDADSYEETSCTAMFTYAFARGIQFGWLPETAKYQTAIHRAWQGLSTKSIDSNGNIYGVCRGSRYSFTPEYYKFDLTTSINDTHGIGIVLLAGIQVLKASQPVSGGVHK